MSAFAKRVLANVREEIRAEVAYALELAGEPELLEALKGAQSVLAMLTEPQAIRATTVHHAWAQAVAAEATARAAIAKAEAA